MTFKPTFCSGLPFRNVALVALGSLFFLTAGTSFGQPNEDYSLTITDGSGPLLGLATVTIFMDNENGEELQGYQWGMCHDELFVEDLSADDIANGALVSDTSFTFHALEFWPRLDLCDDPDDLEQCEEDDPGLLGHGWTVGTVTNVATGETIPTDDAHEMYEITYRLKAEEGDTTVEFCETIGSPIPPVRVIADGVEVEPVQFAGSIAVGGIVPYELVAPDVDLTSSSVDVPISAVCPFDLDAFSFGMSFDASIVDVNEVVHGAALADFNGGTGPSYFAADLEPAGGDGFTVGCVISFGQTEFEVLEAGVNPQEVAVATFLPVAGADIDSTSQLDFTGDLGDPNVPVIMSLNASQELIQTTDGSIFLTIEPVPTFRRGDTNDDGEIDISDPFRLASRLFAQGDALTCEDAGDADDSGALGIPDILLILDYLFSDGDPPEAPFPDCGGDAPTIEEDTDGLLCESQAVCETP